MNKVQDFFIRLMTVLADIFLSAFVFCLFESRVHILEWNFTPWIIFVFSVFLVDYILARRDIHTNIYFAVNVAAVIFLSIWAQRYFVIDDLRALSTRILYAVALSFPVIHGSVVAYKAINRHKMLLYFDALVLLEIIFVGLGESTVFPLSGQFRTLGMVSVAGYLSALMLNRLSSDDESKKKRIIGQSIMVGFVAFLSGMALIASSAFETASQGLINVGKSIVISIFNAFVWVINLFLAWLSSIINTVIIAEVPEIKIKEFGIDKNIYDGKWVIPILLVAIGLGILGVYLRLRGKRIKGEKNKRNKANILRESHLVRGVSKFFKKITGSIKFVISYLVCYNKVSGLMMWTEYHYKKRFVFREKGETPSDFLIRLTEKVKTEEAKEALVCLSSYVEKNYYSNEKESLPAGFSANFRKLVRHS